VTTGWSVERLTADHDLERFDCGVDTLSDWLRTHALQSDRQSDSRVFVAVKGDEPIRVRGYYALVATSVAEGTSIADLFKGAFKGPNGQKVVGGVLLTRFGVDTENAGVGLGTDLLAHLLKRVLDVSESVAFRVLVVDAYNEVARDWYMNRRLGFRELPENSLTLYLPMKQLKKAASD